MSVRGLIISMVLAALSLGAPAARGQSAGGGALDEELRQAIETHFRNRLRAELALSDEQMEAIWPHVEQMETVRRELRHERVSVLRDLRLAYRGGAADAELQGLLDRLTEIEDRSRAEERAALARIDQELSVRQRVEFRFLVVRFRQALRERIEAIRRERGGDGQGPGSWRRRDPARERP